MVKVAIKVMPDEKHGKVIRSNATGLVLFLLIDKRIYSQVKTFSHSKHLPL